MILTKIWERYFLKEFIKTFLLFLICFYSLYILIDYSIHSSSYRHGLSMSKFKFFSVYYASEFVNRSEVLIPFAILIATIKTLCKLNENNELIAMMASGIRIGILLRPFLLIGLFFTGMLYFSNEFIAPIALKNLQRLDHINSTLKYKDSKNASTQQLILEDQSMLLFKSYDPSTDLFFDVYWIRSFNEIYRIKYLSLSTAPPSGESVDHFVRTPQGELTLVDTTAKHPFPDIHFDQKTLIETITFPEGLPLSALWKKLPPGYDAQSEKEARTLSTFHRKLAFPWLCLLAVIAPAPFCIRFSRQFPIFFIYACSLFGLVGICILMDAAHVLGRRQVLDPLWATWAPFGLIFLTFGWRYLRTG